MPAAEMLLANAVMFCCTATSSSIMLPEPSMTQTMSAGPSLTSADCVKVPQSAGALTPPLPAAGGSGAGMPASSGWLPKPEVLPPPVAAGLGPPAVPLTAAGRRGVAAAGESEEQAKQRPRAQIQASAR